MVLYTKFFSLFVYITLPLMQSASSLYGVCWICLVSDSSISSQWNVNRVLISKIHHCHLRSFLQIFSQSCPLSSPMSYHPLFPCAVFIYIYVREMVGYIPAALYNLRIASLQNYPWKTNYIKNKIIHPEGLVKTKNNIFTPIL